MANPRPSANDSPTQASASSKTESSGIGTTTLFSGQQPHKAVQHALSVGAVFSPGTPSDTTSSLSSFTSTGQQMLSPESMDSVVLSMSPVDQRAGIVGKTSTFKAHNRLSMDLDQVKVLGGTTPTNGKCPTTMFNEAMHENGNGGGRSVRPTPPSTLNVIPLRVPPAPPPRWTKADNYMDLTPIIDENAMIVGEQHTPGAQLNELLSPNGNTTVSLTSMKMHTQKKRK